MTARQPPKRKALWRRKSERPAFTVESVAHHLKAARVRAPTLDVPKLTLQLIFIQSLVLSEEAAASGPAPTPSTKRIVGERTMKVHQRRLVNAVNELAEVAPLLYGELQWRSVFITLYTGSPIEPWLPEMDDVIPQVMAVQYLLCVIKDERLQRLLRSNRGGGGIRGFDSWEDFAPRLLKTLVGAGASKAAAYRFIAAIIPTLTGETVNSPETVASIFKHPDRTPKRDRRPLA